MILHVKPGVMFDTITSDLMCIMRALMRLSSHPAVPIEGIWLTSGSDGTHSEHSQHGRGRALDVRSKTFRQDGKYEWMSALGQELGRRYVVLLESEGSPNEHFHIQVRKDI